MRKEPSSVSSDLAFWQDGSLGHASRSDARLLFGQVREDASVELALLDTLTRPHHVFVIASGGCTALSLLTASQARVSAVDINPAQVFLTALKLAALTKLPFASGRALCTSGGAEHIDALSSYLSPEEVSFWSHRRTSLLHGLNNAGWADRNIGLLTDIFAVLFHSKRRTETFLRMNDLQQQTDYFQKHWMDWRWNAATNFAFSKRLLRAAFGKQAIDALPDDFAAVMRQRIARAFTSFPALDNGYLWQTFLSRYPEEREEALPPYLQLRHADLLIERSHNLSLACMDALSWLRLQPSCSIDMFALSNILEIVKSAYGQNLAQEIARTATDGARVITRSIFPPSAPILKDQEGRLRFEPEFSAMFEAKDKSCFCNVIQIYSR